jgi:hypothetical protein
MKSVKIILGFAILLAPAVLCQNIGKWHNYSSIKNITATVSDGSAVWAVSVGGAFKLTPKDTIYKIITKTDGLNSQSLTSIGIDKTNKIWFGSADGYINILDVQNNTMNSILDIYNSNNTLKDVNNIFIKGDTVFASLDFGLSIINSTSFSFIDTFLKLGSFSSQSRVLSAFKSNLVYAVTDQGIAVQKAGSQNLSSPDSWDNYYFNTSFQNVNSATKIISFNGFILLATSNGVYQFLNKSWQPYTLQGSSIIDMVVNGNNLYIITSTQLYQYSNSQSTILYENPGITFTSLSATTQALYISSNNGLIEYKNGITNTFIPNSPINNSFINTAVDPLGNLWVATGSDKYGAGFSKFDGSSWNIYNQATYPILPSNSYFNVYAAPDTTMYLCNWGNGFASVKNKTIDTITAYNSPLVGITDNQKFLVIADCKMDSKGNLWLANSQTASRKQLWAYTKDKQWKQYNVAGLTDVDNLGKLVIDQNDTKWFNVTAKGSIGLYYFNENKTFDNTGDDTQGLIPELSSIEISSLAIDKHGYLWIGTSQGVKVITNLSTLKVASNLGYTVAGQTINCIAVDPLDQKWIGTNQGVFVLTSDGIYPVNQYNTKNSPLPSNYIKSISFDQKNGIVYIGTDFGLSALQTSFSEPQQSFTKLFVYPNPLLLGNNSSALLSIDGLIKNSLIKIISISGNLIREIPSPGGRIAFWDGRDAHGDLVPSGVYIVVAYDSDANNVSTSKVAVLRN